MKPFAMSGVGGFLGRCGIGMRCAFSKLDPMNGGRMAVDNFSAETPKSSSAPQLPTVGIVAASKDIASDFQPGKSSMTASERETLINGTLPLIKHIAHKVALRLPSTVEVRDL